MLLCQEKQIYSVMRRLSQFNFYYLKEKETLSIECLSTDQSFTKTTYFIIMIFHIVRMYFQTNNFKTLKLFCVSDFNVQYYITDCIIKSHCSTCNRNDTEVDYHHALMCCGAATLRSTWLRYFSGIPADLEMEKHPSLTMS